MNSPDRPDWISIDRSQPSTSGCRSLVNSASLTSLAWYSQGCASVALTRDQSLSVSSPTQSVSLSYPESIVFRTLLTRSARNVLRDPAVVGVRFGGSLAVGLMCSILFKDLGTDNVGLENAIMLLFFVIMKSIFIKEDK